MSDTSSDSGREPKSIAILIPDLRPGGVERMHINLAREWLSQGFDVQLLLMRAQGEFFPLIPDELRVIDFQVEHIREIIWPLRRYLRQARPDVMLVAMWPLTVVATIAAKLASFRGRIIVSDHQPLSKSPQARGWMQRSKMLLSIALVYRLADERIAVSRGVAEDLAWLSCIPRRKFKVIYNPAAVGHGSRVVGVPCGIAECHKLVLAVGTLKPEKDYASLIRAFALVPLELNAHLIILGEGEDRLKLERIMAELGLGERVRLPGFVLDPYPYYARADLFMLTSLWEGFSNVLVEALECGVPVVSTDCPYGPGEILDKGTFGRIVPVGDVKAIARAIQESLVAKHDKELLKRRAAEFGVPRIASEYISVMFTHEV